MSQSQAFNAPAAGRPAAGHSPQRKLAIWWREIDRILFLLILLLMAIGALAVAAASPASARRLSTEAVRLDDLHFFWLHLKWQVLGVLVLMGTAMLERELMRRACILLAGAMLVGLMMVPLVGSEVNGARRWLNLGLSLQPSEFLKPAFAVTLAWVLSWKLRDPGLPVTTISFGLLLVIVILLMLQPNFGEAVLFCGLWMVLVTVAGLPLKRIGMVAGGALLVGGPLLLLYDNGMSRILAFLGSNTAYGQEDLAHRTLTGGGWTGEGFWLGTNKLRLPEAHTDYIFSVIGEEFGLAVCGIIVLLYLAIVLRVLVQLVEDDRMFNILAASGLVTLFGAQAFINMLVNLQMLPSKGMTLPLISYGGSSTLAQCFTAGLLLCVTRRNPFLSREKFNLRSSIESEASA